MPLVAISINDLAQAMTETDRHFFVCDLVASLIGSKSAVIMPDTLIDGADGKDVRLDLFIYPVSLSIPNFAVVRGEWIDHQVFMLGNLTIGLEGRFNF